MGEVAHMTDQSESLKSIAEEVARALATSRVRGSSAFVSTPLLYPNGANVVVRIDEDRGGFFVSDDGFAALTADLMGALPTFNRVAPSVAERMGVRFDQRSFFIVPVEREGLIGATASIANASARATERTIYALEQVKVKRSRDLFEKRLHDAFGNDVVFDVTFSGNTGRSWDFDAALGSRNFSRLFAFIAPAFSAVAAANIKISDTRALDGAPAITAVLADYNRTEPALRHILSTSANLVIAANDAVSQYRLAG